MYTTIFEEAHVKSLRTACANGQAKRAGKLVDRLREYYQYTYSKCVEASEVDEATFDGLMAEAEER